MGTEKLQSPSFQIGLLPPSNTNRKKNKSMTMRRKPKKVVSLSDSEFLGLFALRDLDLK